MKERAKKSESTLKNAFEEMLQTYRLKDKFSEKSLISSWGRLMGKTITSRTEKLFIKDKTLFVQLSSAALKHELNSSKDKILKIFEEEFGKGIINDVAFL